MTPQEITLFVESQAARGRSREEIERVLKTNQVSAEAIAAAFAKLPAGAFSPKSVPSATSEAMTPEPMRPVSPTTASPIMTSPVAPGAPNLGTMANSTIPVRPQTPPVAPPPPPPPPPASEMTPPPPEPPRGHWGLVLTIVLILIVIAGGAYLYLNYFQSLGLTPSEPPVNNPPIVAEPLPGASSSVRIIETSATSSETTITVPPAASSSIKAPTGTPAGTQASSTASSTATGTVSSNQSIREQMVSLSEQASTFAASHNNLYTNFCSDATTTSLFDALKQAGASQIICNLGTVGKSFAVSLKLSPGSYLCVDKNNQVKEVSESLIQGTGNTACPSN